MLAVLASYQFGHGWEGGARFRYTTGAPRTPVVGSFLVGQRRTTTRSSARTTRSACRRSISSTRASSARGSSGARKLNVFLDVQNVTNRKNPEEIIYNAQYTVKGYITGLPTLAVLGARLEF